MRAFSIRLALVFLVSGVAVGHAQARGFGGFGGFRGGGFSSFSGSRSFGGGGYSFDRGGSFSGFGGRDYSYSGSRSGYSSYSAGGWGGRSSYDRSLSGSGGGSLSVSGTRGAAVGPWGGAAAGGTRTVSGTTPGGRSFDTTTSRGGIMGPGGNFAAGGSRYGVASGPGGAFAGGSRWGAAGVRFPTDAGLAHYSAIGGYGAVVGHSTAFWSHSYVTSCAGLVRTSFAPYNSFNANWYTLHPAAWVAAGWAANAAWNVATWPSISTFVGISAPPEYLDYGSTVVYQNNNVYVNGTDAGTAEQYNQQAVNLAVKGQDAKPAKTDTWSPLGVFALAQGDESTSNTMFQLAVNKEGIIRGNYYDALMGSTSEVYGSVDPKTQRAAWTIGNNKNTVFETGIYNLTKDQTPVLVHFGKDKTQQWLLVRVEQPKQQGQ